MPQHHHLLLLPRRNAAKCKAFDRSDCAMSLRSHTTSRSPLKQDDGRTCRAAVSFASSSCSVSMRTCAHSSHASMCLHSATNPASGTEIVVLIEGTRVRVPATKKFRRARVRGFHAKRTIACDDDFDRGVCNSVRLQLPVSQVGCTQLPRSMRGPRGQLRARAFLVQPQTLLRVDQGSRAQSS